VILAASIYVFGIAFIEGDRGKLRDQIGAGIEDDDSGLSDALLNLQPAVDLVLPRNPATSTSIGRTPAAARANHLFG